MSDIAIRVENLGKSYGLQKLNGQFGYRTLREDLLFIPRRIWAGLRSRNSRQGKFWALSNVSFEVKQGEVFGVIGRNGSGKSTLLKVLSRIVVPSSGTVDLYGRVGSLLEVGTGFHPELTGRENIFLSGAILGMRSRQIRMRMDEIVAFAGIEQFLDGAVKHYSSGMYARLAFAVAAHLDTDILLLDEVLAVGDAEFQRRCLGKVGEVAKSGRTVLFVSHSMAAVRQLCSSGLVLDQGKLSWLGRDVAEAISHYHAITSSYSKSKSIWRSSESSDSNFSLRLMRLVDRDGIPLAGVSPPQQRIWLEVEWEARVLNSRLSIGYALHSESDEVLYWSFNTDDEQSRWPAFRIGLNFIRTELPRDILNEGSYRIELLVSLHSERWVHSPGVGGPCVTLVASGLPGKSPNWTVRRPGFLSPLCRWEV